MKELFEKISKLVNEYNENNTEKVTCFLAKEEMTVKELFKKVCR